MSRVQVVWFFLLLVVLTIYIILDGFDFGVGLWCPFALITETHSERQLLIRSIAPFWDGNEVWLLAAGGILFAVFPDAYATLLSALYVPLMLLLACLIFRAIAIEFRNDFPTVRGQKISDLGFQIGSIIPAFSLGVILGNILMGLPLDNTLNFSGTLFTLLNPYALLMGCLSTVMFAIHGVFYILWRTEGEITKKIQKWADKALFAYLILYAIAVVTTLVLKPQLLTNYQQFPVLLLVPPAGLGAVVAARLFYKRNEGFRAFVLSAISIALLLLSAAIALYPNLIPAIDPGNSITIFNASSSDRSLTLQLIVVVLGLSMTLAYTIWVYRIFTGTVRFEKGV